MQTVHVFDGNFQSEIEPNVPFLSKKSMELFVKTFQKIDRSIFMVSSDYEKTGLRSLNFEMPLPVTLIMFRSDDKYWKLKTIVSWTVYMTALYDQFNSKTC